MLGGRSSELPEESSTRGRREMVRVIPRGVAATMRRSVLNVLESSANASDCDLGSILAETGAELQEGERLPSLWSDLVHSLHLVLVVMPSALGTTAISVLLGLTLYFNTQEVVSNFVVAGLAMMVLLGLTHIAAVPRGPALPRWYVYGPVLLGMAVGLTVLLPLHLNPTRDIRGLLLFSGAGCLMWMVMVPMTGWLCSGSLGVWLVLSVSQVSCNAVVIYYAWINMSQELSPGVEIAVNGIGYPLFVLGVGRIFVQDFSAFVAAQHQPWESVSKANVYYTVAVKQGLVLHGMVFTMLVNSDTAFIASLILSNVAELASVFVSQAAQNHPLFPKSSRSNASAVYAKSDSNARTGTSNSIRDWAYQVRSNARAKLALRYFGEELADSASIIVATAIAVLVAEVFEQRGRLVQMLLRCLAAFVMEILQDFVKKRIVLRLCRVALCKLPSSLLTTNARFAICVFPASATCSYMAVYMVATALREP